jgi:hypothetical protein
MGKRPQPPARRFVLDKSQQSMERFLKTAKAESETTGKDGCGEQAPKPAMDNKDCWGKKGSAENVAESEKASKDACGEQASKSAEDKVVEVSDEDGETAEKPWPDNEIRYLKSAASCGSSEVVAPSQQAVDMAPCGWLDEWDLLTELSKQKVLRMHEDDSPQ